MQSGVTAVAQSTKHKDLSDFNKGQNVWASLEGYSWNTVVKTDLPQVVQRRSTSEPKTRLRAPTCLCGVKVRLSGLTKEMQQYKLLKNFTLALTETCQDTHCITVWKRWHQDTRWEGEAEAGWCSGQSSAGKPWLHWHRCKHCPTNIKPLPETRTEIFPFTWMTKTVSFIFVLLNLSV